MDLNILTNFLRLRLSHRPQLLKIVSNAGWLFFDQIFRLGMGLLIGVWIARYLGPEQFGLLSFASAFVGIFGAAAGLGLHGIVVRDIVRDPASKEQTLGTAAALMFIAGILTYTLILGANFWVRSGDTLPTALIAILGSMMLFKVSEVAVYWFESQVLSKYTVWVQSATFLLFVAVKVGLLLNNAPLIAFAWASVAEALVMALSMCVMLGLRGPRLRGLHVSMARSKTLLKESWPLLLSGVAVTIYMKIDQVMLRQMVDNEAVGIYSVAVRISEIWYFIPMVVVASLFPAILEAKKRSEAQYYRLLQRLYDMMVLLAVAIALPMTFFSTPLVVLLFGVEYAASGPVLAIHIWAAVFVFLGVASSKWFLAENRQMLSFQRTLLGSVVNVVLNFLLLPDFGAIGAAVATVISYCVAAFLSDLIQIETRRIFWMKVDALNIFYSIGKMRWSRKS